MNSWFFINSYMNLYVNFEQKLFLVHQNSKFFMNSCQISWILASFHDRDLMRNHAWRISWRISWRIWWNDGRFLWIHRSTSLNSWRCAPTRRIWRGQAILPLLLQSHLPHCQPVYSSNFSPSTRPSLSPTYSPEWVTLHDFSSESVVVRTLTNWPIANLKTLMSWNLGLLHV